MNKNIVVFLLLITSSFSTAQKVDNKSDTLFIFTDYIKSNNLYQESVVDIKIKLREKKDTLVILPETKKTYAYELPEIKFIPKNEILKKLFLERKLYNFKLGIQKNICFGEKVFFKNNCNLKNSDLVLIHKDIDYQFITDYNTYLKILDSVNYKKYNLNINDVYGKIKFKKEYILNNFNYTDLSEFKKESYFFSTEHLMFYISNFKVIFIEIEQQKDEIIFEKVGLYINESEY